MLLETVNYVVICTNRKGRQCKAGRDRFTQYQFVSPTMPTNRQRREMANSERQKGSQ